MRHVVDSSKPIATRAGLGLESDDQMDRSIRAQKDCTLSHLQGVTGYAICQTDTSVV